MMLQNGAERIIIDKFAGVNTYEHASKIAENEFTVFENAEFSKGNKTISKRGGYLSYNANTVDTYFPNVIHEYIGSYSGATDYNCLIAGMKTSGYLAATLDNLGGAGTQYKGALSTANGGNVNKYLNARFVNFKKVTYIFNTVKVASTDYFNKTYIYAGDHYTDNHGVPDTDIAGNLDATPSTSGGSMSNGAYTYVITFLMDGYQEGRALSSQDFTIGSPTSSGSIQLGISRYLPYSSNIRVNKVKIYRTKAGETPTANGVYFIAEVNVPNNTTSYKDVTADSALGDNISYNTVLNVDKRPLYAKYGCVHKNRLWMANLESLAIPGTKYKNYIAFSDADKPDLFTASNIFKIDEEEITGIFAEDNRIIVFTLNGIYKIITSAQSSDYWYVEKVNIVYGSDTIVQLPNYNYCFAKVWKNCDTGNSTANKLSIMLWDGSNTFKEVAIPIQNYFDFTNTPSLTHINYDIENQQIIIFFNYVLSGNTKYYILRYDTKTGIILIENNTNVQLNYTHSCNTKNYNLLIAGFIGIMSKSKNRIYDEIGTSNADTAYIMALRTKLFDLQDKDFDFRRLTLIIDAGGSGVSNKCIVTLYDKAGTSYAGYTGTLASGRNKIKINKAGSSTGNFQRMSIGITEESLVTVDLQAIIIDAKPTHIEDAGQ